MNGREVVEEFRKWLEYIKRPTRVDVQLRRVLSDEETRSLLSYISSLEKVAEAARVFLDACLPSYSALGEQLRQALSELEDV